MRALRLSLQIDLKEAKARLQKLQDWVRSVGDIFEHPPGEDEHEDLHWFDFLYNLAALHLENFERGKAIIPMTLWCPACSERHIDAGKFATKPHHTHACQSCGMVWRPAIQPTVGVDFLPGFKD